MDFSIEFKNLPFSPSRKQIIFVENGYNRDVNNFIRFNYNSCKHYCKRHGFDFVYIPLLTSSAEVAEQVQYYAPYLQERITELDLPKSDMLMEYIFNPEDYHKIVPSLMVYGYTNKGIKTFHFWSFPEYEGYYHEWFQGVVKRIETEYYLGDLNRNPYSCPRPKKQSPSVSSDSSFPDKLFSVKNHDSKHYVVPEDGHALVTESIEDKVSDDITNSVEQDIKQLQKTVKRLRMKGITLSAIQEIVVQQEKVSRLVITEDYRILLPDYNNMVIEMKDLPKTLFLFFLMNPEGAALKMLSDYYRELIAIYKNVHPGLSEEKMSDTITRICDPTKNRVNEVLSQIAIAFRSKFDDHLARNYYPVRSHNGLYRIKLDSEMIEFK